MIHVVNRWNPYQKREMSKALFDMSKYAFGSTILAPLIADRFNIGIFFIGIIVFTATLACAMILLENERRPS